MSNYEIFISSCFEGIDIQVPRIIKNILEVNIPVEHVHIIVGGCPSEKVYNISGVEIVNVTYRCFEFTPHIYIVNNPDKYNFDFGFFTHDTVLFGKKFYDIINKEINYLRTTNFDTMKFDNSLPSMNIGIYSKNILLKNKNKLLEISINSNNNDDLMKLKHKLVSYEDFILNQNNYVNNKSTSEKTPMVFEGKTGKSTKGLLREFKNFDFIKYQSNAYTIKSIDVCICASR